MNEGGVVTNTNNSATGNKIATTISNVAMITVTKKALTIIEGQDPKIKPEDQSKPGDTGNEDASNNPTTPTKTKKEVINTSDTTPSMTR